MFGRFVQSRHRLTRGRGESVMNYSEIKHGGRKATVFANFGFL